VPVFCDFPAGTYEAAGRECAAALIVIELIDARSRGLSVNDHLHLCQAHSSAKKECATSMFRSTSASECASEICGPAEDIAS
jgi:hypothetical protein